MRFIVHVFVLLIAGALSLPPALSAWPERPLRMIVPSAAGGQPDTNSRLVATELSKLLGQQVVVDNRPGAASSIGFDGVTADLTGTLTALGAQLLLVRDGHPEIIPEEASGTFTLWIRDGLVYRYKVQLNGYLAVRTPKAIYRLKVKQATTTAIQAVGTTNVVVPDDVRERFGK